MKLKAAGSYSWPILTALLLAAVPATRGHAQEPARQPATQPATLTLEEAIELARGNNPAFRQEANDQTVADWQVRQAYGAFLPTLNVSSGVTYQASGTPRFGLFSAEDVGLSTTPSYLFSDYTIAAGLSLSGATFFRAAQEKANSHAVEARIDAAEYTLETDVTRQYLAALREKENVALQRSVLDRANEALKLAQARVAAGAATRLDAAQAEVEQGRAEVALLQAQNNYATEKLRLLQQLGVEFEKDVDLTTRFEVFEPKWTLEQLQSWALDAHPQLVSLRAAEAAANASSRSARTAYLPTLRLSAFWSGFVRKTNDTDYLLAQARGSASNRVANCEFMNALTTGLKNPLPGRPTPENCARFNLTPSQEAQVLAVNNAYPFNYEPQPAQLSVDISLPIFNGFTREREVQEARVQVEDARLSRRAEELQLRTDIATNLLALHTAYRTVSIEERGARAAEEQLNLAQERYRLGAGSILELSQAQEDRARADQARLNAIFSFHESLAALEAAVGRELR